jgi:hypothetical protein
MTHVGQRDFGEICYRVYVLVLLKREKIVYRSNFRYQKEIADRGYSLKAMLSLNLL